MLYPLPDPRMTEIMDFVETNYFISMVEKINFISYIQKINDFMVNVSKISYGSLSLCPPYITRDTVSPLEKKNVCGSFIFISYWLISHVIQLISS